MASTDARPVPRKNVAMRITFPLRDVNGDLVTGATGLDSEVSKDGGTFADCTNEATEIATSSGIYYLDLTSTEMNADTVAVIVKSSAKTFAIVMYPEEAGDMRSDVTHWNGTAVATPATAGIPEVNVKNINNQATSASGTVTFPNATLASTTNITAGTLTTVTTATNVTTVNGLAANVITAASIAADAIDADALAADAVTEIQAGLATAAALATVDTVVDAIKVVTDKLDTALELDGAEYRYTTNALELAPTGGSAPTAAAIADAVWDEARADHVTAGSFGEGAASVQGNVTGSVGSVAAGGITAASIATNAIDADAIATDAVTEIQSGLATAASIAALNNLSAAQVNAEVVDALSTDTYAEPGAVPAATSSLKDKIGWLFTLARNKVTQTNTTQTVRNDADSGNIATSTVSDDGTTWTRGEFN